MPKKAIWWSQDPRTSEWCQYAPDDNAAIESSFNGSKTLVKLDFAGAEFTVDVKKMVQRNSSGGSRKIKRELVDSATTTETLRDALSATVAPTAAIEHVKATFTNGQDEITVADFGRLFSAMGIDQATAEPFILFFHMQPQHCWQISAEELAKGLITATGKTTATAADVKRLVSEWSKQCKTSRAEFDAMYNWCFEFSRNSSNAAIIPAGECIEYLSVLLPLLPARRSPIEPLLDFLAGRQSIQRDLWMQLPRFLTDVKSDYSNYDDFFFHSALDAFVDTVKK